MITSFQHGNVDELKMRHGEKVKVGHIFNPFVEPFPEDYTSQDGDYVVMSAAYLTPDVVGRVHESGKLVAIYFSQYDENMDYIPYILSIGPDVIITDHPLDVREIVEKMKMEIETE